MSQLSGAFHGMYGVLLFYHPCITCIGFIISYGTCQRVVLHHSILFPKAGEVYVALPFPEFWGSNTPPVFNRWATLDVLARVRSSSVMLQSACQTNDIYSCREDLSRRQLSVVTAPLFRVKYLQTLPAWALCEHHNDAVYPFPAATSVNSAQLRLNSKRLLFRVKLKLYIYIYI